MITMYNIINNYEIKTYKNFFITNPLKQFEIFDSIGFNLKIFNWVSISITNIILYLTVVLFFLIAVKLLTNNNNKLISNKWSIANESVYTTINNIVINQIDYKKGQNYFPFIYTLFIFILINNLIGMVPYSFASTSHFILTFSLSFTIVLGVTILGLSNHSFKYLSILVPSGCPLPLLPLLVLIEFISYLARNISLGLRLAANIFSGHMLLNILSGFTFNIITLGGILPFIFGLLPLGFIVAFSGLEFAIAFIQAQVFIILSCSYLKDSICLH